MKKWEKKDVVYSPPLDGSWKDNTALTPTAYNYSDDVIRIYCGFRDKIGVSRIGFVDVDSSNPLNVLNVSNKPVLDVGESGMFDDNGVILGDVIKVGSSVYMYYVGFQLVNKVKFLAYSGLAISDDGGDSFVRVKKTPILDREEEGLYIRAIHSVIYEDGLFKTWYAVGNGWENIDGIPYPKYDINYALSEDGINFPKEGKKVMENDSSNFEYRIGRPRVYKNNEGYVMNFTYGTTDGRYQAGQAFSNDAITWKRDDKQIGISLSESGWDSVHLSYPSVIKVKSGKTYMFYNGNNMGKDGFGYAELIEGEL